MFSPLAHQFIRKSGCPDAEKSGIKRQGIINLAICDTPCHHYISRRMRLRKHILDLFARPDIPIRHFSLCHGLLHFRLQSLSFPDALHNGKSKGAFHPHPDQVHHNLSLIHIFSFSISKGIGTSGFTKEEKRSLISPFSTFTAPISIIRS